MQILWYSQPFCPFSKAEFRRRLAKLSKAHIYLELFQLDWNKRLDDFLNREKGGSDLLPRKKITQLPANIDTMQKQIKHLFTEVLDIIIADKNLTVQQRMAGYYQKNISSLDHFTFQPKLTDFARIKYRKITKEEFTIWSKMAREMRDITLAGGITLSAFEQWLKA